MQTMSAVRSKVAPGVFTFALLLTACTSGGPSSAVGTTIPTPLITTTLATTTLTTPAPSPAPPSSTPPIGAPTLEPSAIAVPSPMPSVTPSTTPAIDYTIGSIWVPRNPESLDDFSAVFALERVFRVPQTSGVVDRLHEVLAHWIEGPDGIERADGFLAPIWRLQRREFCERAFVIELVGETAVVTLCGTSGMAGVGANARLLASFNETVRASGLVDHAVLLTANGDRCVGNESDDDPLACLPPEAARAGPGFRCPVGRRAIEATATGVDDWVRTRNGPSIEAEEVGRIGAGTTISAYPATLTYGTNLWWVTVRQPENDRCVRVAAQFLASSQFAFGAGLAGVDFELPTTGSWTFRAPASISDDVSWSLDEGSHTSLSLQIVEGRQIDQMLADQLAYFELEQYDFPADWFEEIEVAGADRAVRPVYTISGSGDIGTSQLLVEVGEHTMIVEANVYVEDLSVAPREQMATFVDSISVDRDAFLSALGD